MLMTRALIQEKDFDRDISQYKESRFYYVQLRLEDLDLLSSWLQVLCNISER